MWGGVAIATASIRGSASAASRSRSTQTPGWRRRKSSTRPSSQLAEAHQAELRPLDHVADDVRAPVAVADDHGADRSCWVHCGSLSAEDGPRGLGEDREVERQRAALGVLDVEADHFLVGALVAAADLPEPVRPGLTEKRSRYQARVLGDLVGDRRARPDQGHVAEHDVEELRQLVEAPAPDPAADRGDAVVDGELVEVLAAAVGGGLVAPLISAVTYSRWPRGSASSRMLRNLKRVNSRSPKPTRRWRKRAGPRLSRRIAIATAISSGESSRISAAGDDEVDAAPRAAPASAVRRRLRSTGCSRVSPCASISYETTAAAPEHLRRREPIERLKKVGSL